MPAGANKNVAMIATLAVAIPCLIGLWFALPMFLPMFKWTKVDLPAMSAATGIPVDRLQTSFKAFLRYNPRAEGDPMPWQILSMEPSWKSVHPEAEDENQLLVRCTLVSANTGEPPGTAFINSTFKDRYWTGNVLRLPAGSLGFNAKRPVVIYERMDFSLLDITQADSWQRTVQSWENDDLWEDRDDGFNAP